MRVQSADLRPDEELRAFRARAGEAGHGALATFTGIVRGADGRTGRAIDRMELEHYPGMTERRLGEIVAQARERWEIGDPLVVHRVGTVRQGEDIVLVAVSSRHRAAAFAACEFIVDYLKTRAPFWKKEVGPDGERWVEQEQSDVDALGRWGDGGRP